MQGKVVPFNTQYQTVAQLNSIATIMLYASTSLSIVISALGYFKLQPDAIPVFTSINILIICSYVFLDNRANYLFTKAEMKRRLDWIDNSFGTNFSGFKSKAYFTNDQLSDGIHKLAVNCFENAHHTTFIISRMLPWKIGRTIIFVLLFILSAYFGNREIIRLFFELSLPALLIQNLIRTVIFSSRMGIVYDRFKSLFNDISLSGFSGKTPEALRDIVDYEAALAWASVPMDSEIFENNKERLAKEWDQLKEAYKLN